MKHPCCYWAVLLQVLLLPGLVWAAAPPACTSFLVSSPSVVSLTGDCSWPVGSSARGVVGRYGDLPVAVLAPSGSSPSLPTGDSLHISNAILAGFPLPDPAAAAAEAALRPAGLKAAADAGSLHLQDVRIMVPATTLRQYARHFQELVSEGRAFTDGSSFLHVTWAQTSTTVWQDVGLLVAADLAQLRNTAVPPAAAEAPAAEPSRGSGRKLLQARASRNYVLGVTNSTLVAMFEAVAAQSTPVPLLVYTASNITLGKGVVPAPGLALNRPVFWVGMSSTPTSIDFRMVPNQIVMLEPTSNLTLEWLILENNPLGDARSAERARPSSISTASNLWQFVWDRMQLRVTVINITMVLTERSDLDYYLYWATVYHSTLPFFQQQAQFLKDTIGITKWQTEQPLQDGQLTTKVMLSMGLSQFDSTITLQPKVAPPLPLPPLAPELAALQVTSGSTSPLVVSVGKVEQLQDALLPSRQAPLSRKNVLLVTSNLTWPNGLQVPVPFPVTLLGEIASSGTNATSRAPSMQADSSSTEGSNVTAVLTLDFTGQQGALALPASSQGAQMMVQHLLLKGLAQGPGAASARDLRDPELWSVLLWAVSRPDNVTAAALTLNEAVLVVPAPEFDYLRGLAAGSSSFVVDLAGSSADQDIILTGAALQPSGDLSLATMRCCGLTATSIILKRDPTQYATLSGGYYWPNGSWVPGAAPPAAAGKPAAWTVAVGVVVSVVAAAGLAAGGWWLRRRRQRRRRQAQQLKKVAAGVTGPLMDGDQGAPGGSRDPSSRATAAGSVASGSKDIEACKDTGEISGAELEGAPDAAAGGAKGRAAALWSGEGPAAAAKRQRAAPAAAGRGWLGAGGADDALTMGVDQSKLKLEVGGATGLSDSAGSGSGGSGSDSATAVAGWQRVHQMIFEMSETLKQRRLQATLSTTLSSSNSRGRLQRRASAGAQGSSSFSSSEGVLAQRLQQSSDEGGFHLAQFVTQQVKLLGVIGRGTFASVYKANWRGRVVAVKVLHLPAHGVLTGGQISAAAAAAAADQAGALSGGSMSLQCHERMAVMEAVVSTTMSHPNIVQVYTYELQPLIMSGAAAVTAAGDARPLREQVAELQQQAVAAPGAGELCGWELRLLMEYCEEGSLRSMLDSQRLVDPLTGLPALVVVLPLALDIACAMLHLHSEQLLHGDLKANNVLLCLGGPAIFAADQPSAAAAAAATSPPAADSSTTTEHLEVVTALEALPVSGSHQQQQVEQQQLAGEQAQMAAPQQPDLQQQQQQQRQHTLQRPQSEQQQQPEQPPHDWYLNCSAKQLVAKPRLAGKVADFGLSLALDSDATHVSHMHGGTLTHMAPELLLHGHASKASDVYAFGILLWEMLTGGRAFKGYPVALLAHQVVRQGARPNWALFAPVGWRLRWLVERCWATQPATRPSFGAIVAELQQLVSEPLHLLLEVDPPQQQQQQQLGGSAAPDGMAPDAAGADAGVPAYGVDMGAAAAAAGGGGGGELDAAPAGAGAAADLGPVAAAAAWEATLVPATGAAGAHQTADAPAAAGVAVAGGGGDGGAAPGEGAAGAGVAATAAVGH